MHVGITSGDHAEGLTKGGILASALADGGFVFVSSEQDLDVGILGDGSNTILWRISTSLVRLAESERMMMDIRQDLFIIILQNIAHL